MAQATKGQQANALSFCRCAAHKPSLLLQKITRCISTSDVAQSVRVSRNLLADILGVSVKTISRIKAELENAGWIERHQIKSRIYGMQVGDIWLTPWALQELQLVAPGQLHPVNMPVPCDNSIAIRAAVPPKKAY